MIFSYSWLLELVLSFLPCAWLFFSDRCFLECLNGLGNRDKEEPKEKEEEEGRRKKRKDQNRLSSMRGL